MVAVARVCYTGCQRSHKRTRLQSCLTMVTVQIHLQNVISSTQKEDLVVLHQLASSLHYFFESPGSHVGWVARFTCRVWQSTGRGLVRPLHINLFCENKTCENFFLKILEAFLWNFALSKISFYTVVTSIIIFILYIVSPIRKMCNYFQITLCTFLANEMCAHFKSDESVSLIIIRHDPP